MAKLTMPLGSVLASGAFGGAMVFARTLGKNYARILVTPNNPQSVTQGDSRLLLGALGRASKAVVDPSDWLNEASTVTPAGQTWNSFFSKNAIAIFGSGQTGVAALAAAKTGHAATNWDTQGTSVGLTSLTISYAGTVKTLDQGDQLYALAAHAMNLKGSYPSLFDRTPFTTALASWDSADVVAFVAEIQTVA